MRPISALVAVFCLAAAALAQNPCSDPRQRAGACIPLFNCNSLVTILRNRPVSPENKAFLAKTQCGWQDPQPLVCCTDGIPQTSVPNAGANPPRAGSGLLPVPGSGECGVDTSERIYGGEATKIDEFPWLVLLEYSKPQGKKGFHCGGVLISPRYVLTASHCVNSAELPKTWTLSGVRLGEWDLETEQDCDNSGGSPDCVQEPVQDIPIEKKIPHERYEPAGEQQYNDIALIKLAYPARLSYYVKPICLPSDPSLKDNNVVGDTFQVAGWGKTEKRSQSNIKLKVGVNGTSYDTCNQVYQSTRRVINSSQLCAGGEKGKDSCRGDSGGPLMGQFKSRGKAYTYLAGLVSYGPSPCGQEGWPGVYTRVSQYIDWINSKIEP